MDDRILVFGGLDECKGAPLSTVAQFENDSWSRLGDLYTSRHGHNCIIIDSEVLIVGGYPSLYVFKLETQFVIPFSLIFHQLGLSFLEKLKCGILKMNHQVHLNHLCMAISNIQLLSMFNTIIALPNKSFSVNALLYILLWLHAHRQQRNKDSS